MVTVLTVAAHMAQELRNMRITRRDGFGPSTSSEFIMESAGNMSADYGAIRVSWTDCFAVQMPSNGNGFWHLWFQQNVQSIYRAAAALQIAALQTRIQIQY